MRADLAALRFLTLDFPQRLPAIFIDRHQECNTQSRERLGVDLSMCSTCPALAQNPEGSMVLPLDFCKAAATVARRARFGLAGAATEGSVMFVAVFCTVLALSGGRELADVSGR
jgi:hypothetical protein